LNPKALRFIRGALWVLVFVEWASAGMQAAHGAVLATLGATLLGMLAAYFLTHTLAEAKAHVLRLLQLVFKTRGVVP